MILSEPVAPWSNANNMSDILGNMSVFGVTVSPISIRSVIQWTGCEETKGARWPGKIQAEMDRFWGNGFRLYSFGPSHQRLTFSITPFKNYALSVAKQMTEFPDLIFSRTTVSKGLCPKNMLSHSCSLCGLESEGGQLLVLRRRSRY